MLVSRFKLLLILLLFFIDKSIFPGELNINGFYQGKNVFVMNPLMDSGNEFCVLKVIVNGQETNDDIFSSAFEIDLAVYQFSVGERITISIKHKNNCEPKILNPDVLKVRSTFNVSLMKIDKQGNLTWNTSNESGPLKFIIEQYRWNKWIVAGEIMGKGKVDKNIYSYKVSLNSGENIFRIKQIDFTNVPRYSKEKKYRSNKPPITFEVNKFSNSIIFSDETMYEIYSMKGLLIKKGQDSQLSIMELEIGEYYLNYDNTFETFKVK